MKFLAILALFLAGCGQTLNRMQFTMFDKSGNPLNCEIVEARVSAMLNQALAGCQDKQGKVQVGLVGGNGTTTASVATGLAQAVIVGGAIAGGAAMIGPATNLHNDVNLVNPTFSLH